MIVNENKKKQKSISSSKIFPLNFFFQVDVDSIIVVKPFGDRFIHVELVSCIFADPDGRTCDFVFFLKWAGMIDVPDTSRICQPSNFVRAVTTWNLRAFLLYVDLNFHFIFIYTVIKNSL